MPSRPSSPPPTASHLSGNRPSPTRFRVGHTKLRHLKDAVMPRGDNGIAHREGQRGERGHVQHHRCQQPVVDIRERAAGVGIGPSERSTETDVAEPVEQPGNRRSVTRDGTPSGKRCADPATGWSCVRPMTNSRDRNRLPSIPPPLASAAYILARPRAVTTPLAAGTSPSRNGMSLYTKHLMPKGPRHQSAALCGRPSSA
jgi:hypothetical protein